MVTEKNYKKSDQQIQAPPSVHRGGGCSIVSNSATPWTAGEGEQIKEQGGTGNGPSLALTQACPGICNPGLRAGSMPNFLTIGPSLPA